MLRCAIFFDDKSLRSYSRDEVAAPLREMVTVIENVKAGAFQPDATRSGLIAKQAGVASDSDAELQASSDESPASDDNLDHGNAPGDLIMNLATKVIHCRGAVGRRCAVS